MYYDSFIPKLILIWMLSIGMTIGIGKAYATGMENLLQSEEASEFKAELKTGKIINANNCRLENEKKICEIVEDENKQTVAEYIVEDYWEVEGSSIGSLIEELVKYEEVLSSGDIRSPKSEKEILEKYEETIEFFYKNDYVTEKTSEESQKEEFWK